VAHVELITSEILGQAALRAKRHVHILEPGTTSSVRGHRSPERKNAAIHVTATAGSVQRIIRSRADPGSLTMR
jgi:hypothetical protein